MPRVYIGLFVTEADLNEVFPGWKLDEPLGAKCPVPEMAPMKLAKPFPAKYDDMIFLGVNPFDRRNGTYRSGLFELDNRFCVMEDHPICGRGGPVQLFVLSDVSAYDMWQRGEISSSDYLDMC